MDEPLDRRQPFTGVRTENLDALQQLETDRQFAEIRSDRSRLYRMCELIVSECECQLFTWQNSITFLPLQFGK